MKKLSIIILALIFSCTVFAQKYVPQIGIGTIMYYNAEAVNMGYKSPLSLSVVSMNDPMKFGWNIAALGKGSYLVPAKSLATGTKMTFRIPDSDQPLMFKDDETILFISKAALTELTTTQSFTYNKTKFTAKPLTEPYLINGKDADVIHVASDNGKVEVWVLNNPNFPLMVKMKGNPMGIDFELSSIKE